MIAIPRPPSESSSAAARDARPCGGSNPSPESDDLDDEPVGVQLVHDLDEPGAVAVGMPDGVRARLGQRELQVAEHLRRERLGAQPRDPGQGEPPEGDVLGLGRDRQADRL